MSSSNSSSNVKDNRMGREPIGKLVVRMALPSIAGQIINILYNIVDRIYVGHIPDTGSLALTGLGVSSPFIMIISAFAMLIAGGGAPIAAMALGRGDKEDAEKTLGTSFAALALMGLILTAVGLLIRTPVLRLFGASAQTLPYADDYTAIYLLGTVFVMLSLGLNLFISCQGFTNFAMLSVVLGALCNIILDPVFIFVFQMGVQGAAIATVLSQALSMAFILYFLSGKKTLILLKPQYFKLEIKRLSRIIALGVSTFFMQVTEAAISIVFNVQLLRYGSDLYVGSMTILQSVMQLLIVPLNGYVQGVQPIISYNHGAGNYGRIRQTIKLSLVLMACVSILYYALVAIFPGSFASLFSSNAELTALAARNMPLFMMGMTLFSIQMCAQMYYVGTGRAKTSLFLALLRKVILLIPLAFILPGFFGVQGIFYAEPISDFISITVSASLLTLAFKQLKKEEEARLA